MTPRLIGIEAAAKYLAVSYNTMLDYVRQGLVPTIALPSRVEDGGGLRRSKRIDIRDLDALIEARKSGTILGTEPMVSPVETRLKAVPRRKGKNVVSINTGDWKDEFRGQRAK